MDTSNKIPVACFAPPLTDELLAKYRQLAEALPQSNPVRDIMIGLLVPVERWWNLPESSVDDVRKWKIDRPDGAGGFREVTYKEVPLEKQHIGVLWDVLPWMYELRAMEEQLNELPSGTTEAAGKSFVSNPAAFELRNAAFHLLWYAKELTLDREPLTSDKLPA